MTHGRNGNSQNLMKSKDRLLVNSYSKIGHLTLTHGYMMSKNENTDHLDIFSILLRLIRNARSVTDYIDWGLFREIIPLKYTDPKILRTRVHLVRVCLRAYRAYTVSLFVSRRRPTGRSCV